MNSIACLFSKGPPVLTVHDGLIIPCEMHHLVADLPCKPARLDGWPEHVPPSPSDWCPDPEEELQKAFPACSKASTHSNMEHDSGTSQPNAVPWCLHIEELLQVRELMRQAKSMLQHLPHASGGEQQLEESSRNIDDLEDHDDACIICMDAPRSVVWSPCGHAVVCTDCSKLVGLPSWLCLL